MTLEIILYVIAGILVLVGLAGAILPVLPGAPLVFAGMLLAAWVGDFQTIGVLTVVILGVLAALAFLLDYVATVLGAKRVGASKMAMLGTVIGTLVGIILSPFSLLVSLLLCPFIGAVAGELISGSNFDRSTHVGFATWMGLLFGTLAKLALSFTMLGVFALAFLIG